MADMPRRQALLSLGFAPVVLGHNVMIRHRLYENPQPPQEPVEQHPLWTIANRIRQRVITTPVDPWLKQLSLFEQVITEECIAGGLHVSPWPEPSAVVPDLRRPEGWRGRAIVFRGVSFTTFLPIVGAHCYPSLDKFQHGLSLHVSYASQE